MNVLVTGGAGFIGQHLVRKLMELGYFTVVYDLFDLQAHRDIKYSEYPGDKVLRADIRNRTQIKYALQEYDIEVIFHLASFIGAGQSMYDIKEYTDHNVVGTATLMDVLANEDTKVDKVILASSRAVYGEGPYYCSKCIRFIYPDARVFANLEWGFWHVVCPSCNYPVMLKPMYEDGMLKPTSIYGASKLSQENLLKITAEAYDLGYVILRLFNVYGPGQSVNNPYTGIISIFMNWALRNEPIHLYEDGKMIKDFVYIDDVVAAFIHAMDLFHINDTFNVGTGIPITLGDAAKDIVRITDSESEIEVSGQFRVGDARHGYADTTKAELALEFKSKIGLTNGLMRLHEWARHQPLGDLPEDEKLAEKGLSK